MNSFQAQFPTRENLNFGLNNRAIDDAADEIEARLRGAENSVAPEKRQQARAAAKNRIHLILEVDKDNPHIIKNVEVVESNWFSWQITKLKKLFEGSSEGKTYHFGKGGAIHDLTKFMKDLSSQYDRVSQESSLDSGEIDSVVRADHFFNPTTQKIDRFLELISSNPTSNKPEIDDLRLHRDISIAQIKIRQGIERLDSDKAEQAIIDIMDARKDLYFRGYHIHKYSEEDFTAFDRIVTRTLKENDFNKKILQLAVSKKVNIDKILINSHKDDPLKAQIQQIQQIQKNLVPHLNVVLNPHPKHSSDSKTATRYIEAGIRFIEGFHELDAEMQEMSGLWEQFDRVDFFSTANDHLDSIATEIREMNTEDAGRFVKRYETYVDIQEKLVSVKKDIKREELTGIKERLSEISSSIEENLSSKRGELLRNIQERYEERASELEASLSKLGSEQEELRQLEGDTKKQEQLHQSLIDELVEGKIDIGLTFPAQSIGLTKQDKSLILALKELVEGIKMTKLDEGQRKRLDNHFENAGLNPVPPGVSYVDYLNSPDVGNRLGTLYLKVSEVQEKTTETVMRIKTKLESALHSKKEDIEKARLEHEKIVGTEITVLLSILGLEEDANSIELTQFFRESDESEFEAKAEAAIVQLEKHFADQPTTLNRIKELKQKSFDNKFLSSEVTKFTDAFLQIAGDMFKRRDKLAKQISTYENLQFPELYEAKASVLKTMLEKYKTRLGLPHFQITKDDLDKKSGQYIRNGQQQELSSLLDEQDRILEMVAAYKYNDTIEFQVSRLEQQLDEAEAAISGLNQLFDALNHLTRVSASYSEGAAASQKLKELKSHAKEKTEQVSVMETRQKVLDEKITLLNDYYSKQANLSAAAAMAGLMDLVKEFQSAFIEK